MRTFRVQTFINPVDPIFFFTVIFVATGLICFDSRCNGSPETSAPSYINLCGEGYRCINRKDLRNCSDQNPDLQMNLSTQGPLPDEEFITVTVNGLSNPTDDIWVALVSPSSPDISNCPLNLLLYLETGDAKQHSLLCHYTVKSQFLKSDPSYRACIKSSSSDKLQKARMGFEPKTCNASITFHVINIRTDIEFVLLSDGYENPCVLRRSEILKFSNPNMPLYAHLSSVDSTGSSMKVTWISGSNTTQFVKYGFLKSAMSTVTTFTRADMCSNDLLPSPAMDFGWHDPGYIHTALMKGLRPSGKYSYKYGSDNVGWSSSVSFSTPPASGAREVRFLAFGDMGKAPRDPFSHRPMYSSVDDGIIGIITPSVDANFAPAIEQLLLDYQVDLVLWGHVHNYERTCALFQKTCKSLPTKGVDGVDTYNSANYSAPVHAVIGMAGFSLDNFIDNPDSWSLVRFSEYGYARVHATTQLLLFEFVNSDTRAVKDSFRITR